MTQDYGQPGAQVRMPREINGLAIASFVTSLVGLCTPLGVLGLIFGYIARKQIRTRDNSGEGLATAGIVLGWLSLIGFIILAVVFIVSGIANWDQWQENWKDNT